MSIYPSKLSCYILFNCRFVEPCQPYQNYNNYFYVISIYKFLKICIRARPGYNDKVKKKFFFCVTFYLGFVKPLLFYTSWYIILRYGCPVQPKINWNNETFSIYIWLRKSFVFTWTTKKNFFPFWLISKFFLLDISF